MILKNMKADILINAKRMVEETVRDNSYKNNYLRRSMCRRDEETENVTLQRSLLMRRDRR